MTGSDLQAQITAAKAVVLTEEQISRILREAEHVLGAYVRARGTTACEIAAHLVTGTRPWES